MNKLSDKRRRRDYSVAELVTGCISMFLFKQTTRNGANNDRQEEKFRENYYKLFKLRLPHMDTVERFLRLLDPEELEKLKAVLVCQILEKRVLHRFRFLGKWFTVAIDGTGTNSYDSNDGEGSRIYKTSKKGVVTYMHHVVEAKLVTSSGLAISLASEWVNNKDRKEFEKQDCEREAFVRLAAKLKEYFPRLPICILADGLYPNKTFMQICKENNWTYVVVFPDDILSVLHEDIYDLQDKHRSMQTVELKAKGQTTITKDYTWLEEPLEHEGCTLYWVSCEQVTTHNSKEGKPTEEDDKKEINRFVFITNIKPTGANVREICQTGRNRWKIENQGYNSQKNGGYSLGHKFSRNSFSSYRNYYQCLQIAHMINSFVEHSSDFVQLLQQHSKQTVKNLWKKLMETLSATTLDESLFEIKGRYQIRLKSKCSQC
ncbi:transposase family protein [Arachidicoccus ginsenosidivorans]